MNYLSLANDPRLVGTLMHVQRTHEPSADPHQDARLVALGLAYYNAGQTRLTITLRGRRVLQEAGEA